MLSLFFKKNKIWFGSKFGAGTLSQRKITFYTFLDRKQHFHIQRQPKCHSNTSRTPSPMSSHWLHCQDYRDNVYIFTYTFYLYVPCTIKHPKHPKRIRFTCTSCVSVSQTPPTLSLSVYAPLTPIRIRLTPLIRIHITYTFNIIAPFNQPL